MHRIIRAAVLAVLLTPVVAAAQTGGFVTRLGNDTIAVERFTRTATRIEGTIVARQPSTRVSKYVLTLGPDGAVTGLEQQVLSADGSPFPGQPTGMKLAFVGDTVIREMTANNVPPVRRTAVPRGTIATIGGSGIYAELLVASARRLKTDSVPVIGFGPQQNAAAKVNIKVIGADSAELVNQGFRTGYKLSRDGRVTRIDGTLTTGKTVVTAVRDVDVAAIATAWAAKDAAGQALGAASTRDTARATIGGATVALDYGRPAARGREIWGKLVPLDTVWRFGANQAAQLKTDKDLVIGGATVPAGTYTVWLLPTKTGATFIVNKLLLDTRGAPLWGTMYDEKQDLVRVPMTWKSFPDAAERYTVTIAGGELVLHWDKGGYTVKIAAK